MEVVHEAGSELIPCARRPRRTTLVKHTSHAGTEGRSQTMRRRRSSGSLNKQKMKKYFVSGEEFILPSRYSPLKLIGIGSFGSVCSALDTQSQSKVAIKKIKDVLSNPMDGKRVVREIKLLKHFDHPNIVKLVNVVDCSLRGPIKDLCLVMEYVPTDLQRVLRSSSQLSQQHISYVGYQVLCGLLCLHSSKVVHRDLKPSNILVTSSCKAKLCDFGLARGIIEDEQALTEYVVTRWYRAPELILGLEYDTPIDLWGLGCVIAEMFTKQPLFRGDNYVDQLDAILKVLGVPSEEDLSCVKDDGILDFIKSSNRGHGIPWNEILPNAPEDAVDLISKLVVFNPSLRLTAAEAVRHPFFSHFFDEEFVRKSSENTFFDFSYERMTRHNSDIAHILLHEMNVFDPSTLDRKLFKEKHKLVSESNVIYFSGRRRSVF